jgi:hypothetical protein
MVAIIVNGWNILRRVVFGSCHEMCGSWLRHFATIWKVAASIPNGVTEIFYAQSFRPHYNLGVGSASNRNEYQEYFLGAKGSWWLTTLPLLCANFIEIWEPQNPGTLRAYPSSAVPF